MGAAGEGRRRTVGPHAAQALLAADVLQTIAKMGADGRNYVLSSALVAELTRDPTSAWNEYKGYRRVGKVNEWQVAELLEGIDVFPTNCGPKRLRGYLFADFSKAFAHFRVQSSHPLSAIIKQTKKRSRKSAASGEDERIAR